MESDHKEHTSQAELMTNRSATYQGRLVYSSDHSAFLDDYASRYNQIERRLYADMRKTGKAAASFKNGYLIRFGITVRQFNAIGRNLEGKIKSIFKLLPLRKQELEIRIAKAEKVIRKARIPFVVHQKKRRLHSLRLRLAAVETQIADNDPRICFGSRSLFRKQFNLEENGYSSHAEWRKDWNDKRDSQFYVLGSKDETIGCQGCTISANLDGSFNLRLRSLSKKASYLEISNVRIPYGQDVIRQAMCQPQAISYRFLRDAAT